ncbi:MAG: hypothetical protein GEV10_29050 [Streptosporangiales bacterium]|nr:hypothetical protein [Streptosporangiales bacterium]
MEASVADDIDLLGTDRDERPVDFPPEGLVTLRYLWDAVRRHVRLWGTLAIAGIVLGLVVPVVLPSNSEASVKLLLVHEIGEDPLAAMATDTSLATTRSVAQRVVSHLSLSETPDDLLKQYTAASLTDRVLEISVTAPSDAEARNLASTVARTFLRFRMEQVRAEQEPVRQQLASVRSRIESLVERRRHTADETGDQGEGTDDPTMQRAQDQAAQLEQKLEDQELSASLMSSSRILDPAAPVETSKVMTFGINVLTGLVGGLVVGVGFVVVRALVSDRLWRRRQVADALGAAVTLSLGRIGRDGRRALPWSKRRTEVEDLDRTVRHLGRQVSSSPAIPATLGIVAVDDVTACTSVVRALTASFAADGENVLVADLTRSGVLAKGFDVTVPGTVTSENADDTSGSVAVHLPDEGAGPPLGRLDPTLLSDDADLEAAWTDADVVLVLAELSPALGGDHLASWCSDVVAVVTAGRSTATKLYAAGEMVRLAGVRLDSAIMLGTDSTDETIGLPSEASVRSTGVLSG